MYIQNNEKDFILLVTNNDKIKNSVYEALEEGYNLINVASVEEALSVITLKLPNIFIADIDPEYANGIELIKRLRTGVKTKLTPFILISSTKIKYKKIEAIEMGADHYMPFPFDPEELKAIVKLRLNKFKEFYLFSVTDELTRLYNRKEFMNKFQHEIIHFPDRTLSLSILDIDFFKKVNDLYGHLSGDLVLMRLAELLKKETSANFFPARFGGEEFVIIHPNLNMQEAKKVIDNILSEFGKIEFKSKEKTFHVTFSAGIAEYPLISQNVSELLSRADQALYAAKEEGKNRAYIFDQLMSRNDKFWNYLNNSKSYYIDKNGKDIRTGLPFLPNILEKIMMSDFEIQSIGLIIMRINFIEELQEEISIENIKYDLENIKMIIKQASTKGLPSDVYLAIADFFFFDFIILFPSITNFAAELEGFKKVCREICEEINQRLTNLNIEIQCNSGVIFEEKTDPFKIYLDIAEIKENTKPLSQTHEKYNNYIGLLKNKQFAAQELKDKTQIANCYDMESKKPVYQFLRLNKFNKNSLTPSVVTKIITNEDELRHSVQTLKEANVLNPKIPLIFPFIKNIVDLDSYAQILAEEMPKQKTIVTVSEHELVSAKDPLEFSKENFPKNIMLGLRDCYISQNILSSLSLYEFDLVILSESLLRNIHYFKERINIIHGLKLFLDQVNIPPLAKGIHNEEEFLVLKDLNFSIFSGDYIEEYIKKN